MGALLLSAAAGAPFFDVWPRPDNPDLDQRGSPGVTRNGPALDFQGTVPWVGRHTSERRAGHRVSFGDAPPDETPEPRTWEHYSKAGVTLHGERKGTEVMTPEEFESKARTGFFVITLAQNLLIATVFFFVLSMLLRVKRLDVRAAGAFDVLLRCLIPACLLSGVLLAIATPTTTMLAGPVFLLVLGLNALLYVLWARPPADAAAMDV